MGLHSWRTADTQKSILLDGVEGARTVYMLSPDGNHIREDAYDGYAMFGGVDAMVHLFNMNFEDAPFSLDMTNDEKRDIGLFLTANEDGKRMSSPSIHSGVFMDDSGQFYCRKSVPAILLERAKEEGLHVEVLDVGIAELREKLDSGQLSSGLEPFLGSVFYGDTGWKFEKPLKFSFNSHSDYDALPASKVCPNQGLECALKDEQAKHKKSGGKPQAKH